MQLTYQNILDRLKEEIPELYEHPDYDEIAPDYSGDLPHLIINK